jgi:hypothetical protein
MNENNQWLARTLVMEVVDFLTDCRKVQAAGMLDELSRDELYRKLKLVKSTLIRLEELEDVDG